MWMTFGLPRHCKLNWWTTPSARSKGYSGQLTESSLNAEVHWTGKKPLPSHRAFRVKVTWPAKVDNPKLYAIYIEQ